MNTYGNEYDNDVIIDLYLYMLLFMYKLNQWLLFPKSMVELAPQERAPNHAKRSSFSELAEY